MEAVLQYFHGEWYASDLIIAGIMAAVVTAISGRFYPRGTPPERINKQLQQGFMAFNFLVYGLAFLGVSGISRGNTTEVFIVYLFVSFAFLEISKTVYRRFLANEDMDWWLSKVLEERLKDERRAKFE